MAIINTTLNKLRMLQYFIAEQTFLTFYFPLTIAVTTHIPSTITLTKLYLSALCAKGFKPPPPSPTYITILFYVFSKP